LRSVTPERSSSRLEAATIKFTHFPLDSRNENLPEKRIHRNYASRPGGMPRRAFCCAPASRGRARRILCDNKRLGDLSDLTPSEAADLAKVIDVYVGALATKGFEERLTKLENATER
jgi:hypothetical protein